jgi:hypothetical protein
MAFTASGSRTQPKTSDVDRIQSRTAGFNKALAFFRAGVFGRPL